MLTFKQPQEILLGAAVWVTLLSGAFPAGAWRWAACAHASTLLSQRMASHSTEHTWVCHFWFHFISTLPSGWWPQSPPGNLHTGSHGYLRLSDRRLLRADGHWLWVRQRLGDMGVAQHSAASFSPPPETLNIDTHTHTHTETFFPRSCLVLALTKNSRHFYYHKCYNNNANVFRVPTHLPAIDLWSTLHTKGRKYLTETVWVQFFWLNSNMIIWTKSFCH